MMVFKNHVFIIAEAGVNHNGSLDLALELINTAKEAGADAVKFQTYKTENLITRSAPKADYQNNTIGSKESQYEMLKKLELDVKTHHSLFEQCLKKKIQFLSTPFDIESLEFLMNTFDLSQIKISSGEITNAPLLLKAAHTGKPIMLSTGMSTLEEIRSALGVLAFGYLNSGNSPTIDDFGEAYQSGLGQKHLKNNVTLLHCTTEYPTPFNHVNLMAMDTLKSTFGLSVGYSDHTPGISVSIAAVARGAVVIEKHFTLNRNLPGPDHSASLEPGELKSMIQSIREVEESLGSEFKTPTSDEIKNLPIVRKTLVALKEIKKGESFTLENLGAKRPGFGVSPYHYWEFLGKRAPKDFQKDEMVNL